MNFTGVGSHSYDPPKTKSGKPKKQKAPSRGRSAAAWAGLENTKKGDATWAYRSVMKDAREHNYNVTKEEAARIAKKYIDSSAAVAAARRHHGVTVGTKAKKKK